MEDLNNFNQSPLNPPSELETWGVKENYQPNEEYNNEMEEGSQVTPNNVIDYFLTLPSVPLSLRKRFLSFWEMVPLGNYDKDDIRKLEVTFNGLLLDMLMSIPDEEWNTVFKFKAKAANEQEMEMDLNSLFSTLKIAFYIQLTRGKKGFTAKLIGGHPLNEGKEEEHKKISIF